MQTKNYFLSRNTNKLQQFHFALVFQYHNCLAEISQYGHPAVIWK